MVVNIATHSWHWLNYLHKERKKILLLSYNGAPESRMKTRWSRLIVYLTFFSHRKIAGVATLGSLKAKVLKGNVLRNDSVIKARTTISYWTKQFTKNMKMFKRFNFQIPVIKYAYGYFCSFGSQTLSKFTELKLLTN